MRTGASWPTSQHAGASDPLDPLVDPLVDTRELVDPLVNAGASWSTSQPAPKRTSFQGGAMQIIRVTWGF